MGLRAFVCTLDNQIVPVAHGRAGYAVGSAHSRVVATTPRRVCQPEARNLRVRVQRLLYKLRASKLAPAISSEKPSPPMSCENRERLVADKINQNWLSNGSASPSGVTFFVDLAV